MKTATESDNWRKKYFDSLESLEREQQQFRALEAALKRIAGRLCTAALGQSPALDDELKRLQNAIRRDVTTDELDKLTPALTNAIQALDDSASPSPTATIIPVPSKTVTSIAAPVVATSPVVDERVRAILAALLIELKRDPELAPRAETLDAKLTDTMTPDQLSEVLGALNELVGQRIQRIETAKQEIETLLNHMVGKLDEIGQFVAEQTQSQSESQASSETLNTQLAGEMKAMGESVESAGDLQQIRWQVRSRIESIDRHLQAFREREATLGAAMRARNEQMRERIVELESEAKRLQTQIKDEQRLSTLDPLTQIPNRLAYESRVQEEIKRWQRFKQPTCIAVWDVDHFKRINDTYGHRAGDRVLRAVAECLVGRIRSTDFIARYGGEEFVGIFPGTTLESALRVMDELRVAVSKIGFHFRGSPVSITASSGITALLPGDSAGAAFDRADKALYQAKQRGRNQCVSA
ncbi:MAG: diguanylate cyclase [Steroidobacter sp.]